MLKYNPSHARRSARSEAAMADFRRVAYPLPTHCVDCGRALWTHTGPACPASLPAKA